MGRALTPDELLAWKDRIGRQSSSGLSVAEFCRREQVSVANFHFRKRKLSQRPGGGATTATPRKPERRALGSKGLSAPSSIVPKKRGRSVSRQADAPQGASFFQIPLPEPGGDAWIEIVSPDGTLIRLPQQNLAAFELALAALSGRNGN